MSRTTLAAHLVTLQHGLMMTFEDWMVCFIFHYTIYDYYVGENRWLNDCWHYDFRNCVELTTESVCLNCVSEMIK